MEVELINIVSFGGGTNSAAMLVGLHQHGIPVDLILFADTGAEQPHTYCFIETMNEWLAAHNKRCSQKHKIAPQGKFCNNYPPCREVWASGERVTRFLGYDAGEIRRYNHSKTYDAKDKKYHNRYPLIEWGWSRTDCVRALEAAGLPQPGKSSCFFCPSMKREEIMLLKEQHPDLYARAIAIEDNARPRLEKVKGLGRNYAWKDRFGKE